MEKSDVSLIPLAAVGVCKGVLEVYVVPTIERYKPQTLEEKIDLAGLACGIGGIALAAHAIYRGLKDGAA